MADNRLSEKFDALSDKAKESANKLQDLRRTREGSTESRRRRSARACHRDRGPLLRRGWSTPQVGPRLSGMRSAGNGRPTSPRCGQTSTRRKTNSMRRPPRRDADDAEDYASDAISFAQGAIEEAEAAALDAVYARANAVALGSGVARP